MEGESDDYGIYTDENGKKWVLSGDLGYRDDDGYFFFSGRKKRLVIISGYNVYPTDIEKVVGGVNGVRECCAVQGWEGQKSVVRLYLVMDSKDKETEETKQKICTLLEEHEEASLFFLLKDSDSRSELVARFMGILELIKIQRIKITSVTIIEDVVEYDENGLEMMFALNPDYIPGEAIESEFDTPHNEENDESKKEA
jgi:acyl-CoA synthetase (AMP-forming)/AMP-acid ligase II